MLFGVPLTHAGCEFVAQAFLEKGEKMSAASWTVENVKPCNSCWTIEYHGSKTESLTITPTTQSGHKVLVYGPAGLGQSHLVPLVQELLALKVHSK